MFCGNTLIQSSVGTIEFFRKTPVPSIEDNDTNADNHTAQPEDHDHDHDHCHGSEQKPTQ